MITIVATAIPNEKQKKKVAASLGVPIIIIIGPFFSDTNWTTIISSPLVHQTNVLLRKDIKTESETFGLIEFPEILPTLKPLPM